MNYAQKEQLVQFVEKNYISLFETSDAPTKKKLWKLITAKLNAMGTNKNEEGWKRSFTSLRASTKSKYLKNQGKILGLSAVELKIVKMCKMKTTTRSSATLEVLASPYHQILNYSEHKDESGVGMNSSANSYVLPERHSSQGNIDTDMPYESSHPNQDETELNVLEMTPPNQDSFKAETELNVAEITPPMVIRINLNHVGAQQSQIGHFHGNSELTAVSQSSRLCNEDCTETDIVEVDAPSIPHKVPSVPKRSVHMQINNNRKSLLTWLERITMLYSEECLIVLMLKF